MRLKLFLTTVLTLALSTTTGAQTWDEMADGGGDAGSLPATAQVVLGSGPLTTITGELENSMFTPPMEDMFQIYIDDAAAFEATTFNSPGISDTIVYLFDSEGYGVTMNDDDPQGVGVPGSRITGQFVPGPGEYYLTIVHYTRWAFSQSGEIWDNMGDHGLERPPDGIGAGDPINSWDWMGYMAGEYQIDLQGACFVPEPTNLSLLALGGVALIRRRS